MHQALKYYYSQPETAYIAFGRIYVEVLVQCLLLFAMATESGQVVFRGPTFDNRGREERPAISAENPVTQSDV
jgi:hypothetical protein